MKVSLVFATVFVVALGSANHAPHPLSMEFIDEINEKATTWVAGRNFDDLKTNMQQIRGLLGVRRDNYKVRPKKVVTIEASDIPENFDARENWPDCKSLKVIRDQAVCGSCWAFGAVEAMSDRICIASKGKKQVSVSAQDLLACCTECGFGCNGGFPLTAWQYWQDQGIVTGGLYNTTDGCQAYCFAPCDHHVDGNLEPCGDLQPTPRCNQRCDAGVNLKYEDTLTFGQEPYILGSVKAIQTEIMTNGPVEVDFDVYEDFLSYKSGVYKHVSGSYAGGHAVKFLGWGVENDTPYWLVANSWNEDWGDQGLFKIVRGENHCGIEGDVIGALPVL